MMYRLKKSIVIALVLGCLSACDQPISPENVSSSSSNLVEDAAATASNVQDAVQDIFGGTDPGESNESGSVPRDHWKSSRRGRQQARMLASGLTSETQMQNNAVQLVQALGGTRWIVAFYADIESVEDWPNGPAVDSKRADYLGSVRLDPGRPPKIRFSPPGNASDSSSDDFGYETSRSDSDEEQATTLLSSAKRLMEEGKHRAAKLQLQTIVKKYPQSSFGSEALELLNEIQ